MSVRLLAVIQKIPLLFVCTLVVAPILMLLQSWWVLDQVLWQHLWQTQLLELVINTLILLFGVGIGVTLIGVPLAWLTAVCDFPGRRFFDWALILPLAIPAYVLAFVTLGIYDFGGAVQVGMRALGYQGYFDARHPLMVIWVMTAVLYPYVYLLVRASFLSQGTHMLSVARTLGRSPLRAFFEVVLPSIRPALVAGVALALMEALSDFGAVSIFGFNTFTTAIYKSWLSLFSLNTAAQLATLLLLFVMICLYGERASRKNFDRNSGRDSARGSLSDKDRIRLPSSYGYCATGFCALILLFTVAAPFIQLLIWAKGHWITFLDSSFYGLVAHTFILGLFSAAIVILLSIAISVGLLKRNLSRHGRVRKGRVRKEGVASDWGVELAGLGYALPGSVLAIGIMLCLSSLDRLYIGVGHAMGYTLQPFFLGSLLGLFVAYLIRFFRPGFGAVQSGINAVHINYIESAKLMGVSRWSRFIHVTIPLILPGVLTGALIVFVDVIKEMPATLLLRPFGWDTLAVKLYELTSEGQWQRAAVPAICLVMISLAPVLMLIRQSRSALFGGRKAASKQTASNYSAAIPGSGI